jgi:hypothetical protein
MWLFTTDGYYSIVHDKHCKDDELMVRARCREDLERLKKRLKTSGDIIKLEHADYRYRLSISREKVIQYLSRYVSKLKYSNYKNTLPTTERDRHDAYFKCWKALNDYQHKKIAF